MSTDTIWSVRAIRRARHHQHSVRYADTVWPFFEWNDCFLGRAEKEVLCFQHLQYHHKLSSRAAKKIVFALLSYTPKITPLFHRNDVITQSKCAVRKMKSRCPLIDRHVYGTINELTSILSRTVCSFARLGLNDQHQVPNVPCDRADQEIFLFPHLTYFHKLNAKAATKLIRALIVHKSPSEPLFYPNEPVTVSDQMLPHQSYKNKSPKQTTDKQKKKTKTTDSEAMPDYSSHVSDRTPFDDGYWVIDALVSDVSQYYSCKQCKWS